MLTEIQVKSSKLTLKGETKTLNDSRGLLLYITHTGKYWRISYRFNGKPVIMSIGKYPIVSLLEARQKQMEIKKILHDGKNPIAERKKVPHIVPLLLRQDISLLKSLQYIMVTVNTYFPVI